MTELELKFIVPAQSLASLRTDLLARGARRVRLRAHYFDTADFALARHRAALRLRLEGRRWVQTLKAAGAGAVHRLEHDVPVPGPAGQRPELRTERHQGHPAADGLQLALKSSAEPTLLELHATDVQRLLLTVRDAQGSVTEIALDEGAALAAGRRDALQELELEHKGGPLAGLFELAIACVRHGGLWQSTLTKAERGLRLHLGQPAPKPTPFRAAKAAAEASAAEVMRASLQAVLTPLLAHAGGLCAATAADAAHAEAQAALSAAFGADLQRLCTWLGALPGAGHTVRWRALPPTLRPGRRGPWLEQLQGLQAQWQHHARSPMPLADLARGARWQVLWLQLQHLAHADDTTWAAAGLWPADAAAQRASLVAAGLLQA